jgi:outer membrane immunogenic protein
VLTNLDSHWHNGLTIGGGLEYALVPNWLAKVEYQYTSFAEQNYFRVTRFGLDLSIVRGGINYRF